MRRHIPLMLIVLSACRFEQPPISPPPPTEAASRFTEDTAAVGLAIDDPTHEVDTCVLATFMARGAAAADIDGDGDDDLFLPHPTGPDRLFENVDGVFAPRAFDGRNGAGALFFDLDGDNDFDLFVGSVGLDPPRMYKNDGRGIFTLAETALAFQTDQDGCHHVFGASAADFDNDGDLDLFTAAWVDTDGSKLFVNDGTGHFTDETTARGLHLENTAGLVPFPIHLDNDDHLDLILAADFDETRVFHGQADHTFVDVTETSTLTRVHDLMGIDAGDIDGDDDLDLFTAGVCYRRGDHCDEGFGWTGNRFFERDGNTYRDRTTSLLADAGWAWGSTFFDADLDGDLDLIVASGYQYLLAFEDQPVRLFENDGHGGFTETATTNGLVHHQQSRTVLPFDPDHDGDLDVLVVSAIEAPRFFRNHTDPKNAVTITLDAPLHGVGSTVRATLADGRVLRRDVHRRTNYLSSRPPRIHFGMHNTRIVSIEVTWPDGAVQVEDTVRNSMRIRRAG